MILLIDNYDSFTYNLVHLLGELGAETRVVRNDKITAEAALALTPQAIVLSPGPCTPDQAGICLDLVAANAGRIPLLGVCLGHQAIAQAYGGRIVPATTLMHGKLSALHHQGTGLFDGVPADVLVTRYHSLCVDPTSVPSSLKVTATAEDGTIMALEHSAHPVFGVQFHPESIACAQGPRIVANFLKRAGVHCRPLQRAG